MTAKNKTTTNLTEKEIKMLDAIVHSEYQNDESNPVGYGVWFFSVAEGRANARGGVMASLIKKGFAESWSERLNEGEKPMDVCLITQAGFDALKAAGRIADLEATDPAPGIGI